MNIRFLETAVCLAQCGSFRLTAERLSITQAAISSRIATMEHELGIRLFDRQSRVVVPTPEGEAFVQGARQIVEMYELLAGRLRVETEFTGRVRIGLVPSMAQLLLPEIAHTLRRDHPAARFEVVTDHTQALIAALEESRIDVCLMAVPDQPPQTLMKRELCTLGMFWVASPALLPPSEEPCAVSDLVRFPLIGYLPQSLNGTRMREFIGQAGEGPHTVHVSNSLATTIHMAVHGIGVAVVPPVVIQRELREGLLHVVPVLPTYPSTSYVAAYSATHASPLAQRTAAISQACALRLCARFDPMLARIG